jgi:alpha-aminoadipic semialdehyde synthase
VQRLTKDKGLRVLIEPSNRRVFTNAEYEAAGAEITTDLSPCGTIFGVKQVPVENLLPDRTYVFFSHVIKAQPENMELLDTILEKNVRLMDYECINQDGLRSAPRLIAFGGYAGRAGVIDGLRGLGERFLSLGEPFFHKFLSSTSLLCNTSHVKSRIILSKMGTDQREPKCTITFEHSIGT